MESTHRININAIRNNGKVQMCWGSGDTRIVIGDVPEELGKILKSMYIV